jgi:acetoin utilization deacetylase AcuC-like enzyme
MQIFHDPRSADYGPSTHPEKPERIIATSAYLRETYPSWPWTKPAGDVPDETLLLAHTPEHLARLEIPKNFDGDTAYYPGISQHARRSVSSALEAMRHAAQGKGPAFSLMRPPGHHATREEAMGFCYLNQVAIAALSARKEFGMSRVAVWDFDVHHGNGTEDILLGKDGFLFCSVHQSPCYPGTGLGNMGNCRNWSVAPGTPRELYMDAFRASLDAVIAFDPDLVLVSAGFDGYARDPLAQMTLEKGDFSTLGAWLRNTGISSAAVLEGGYSPDLPRLVAAFLEAWNWG